MSDGFEPATPEDIEYVEHYTQERYDPDSILADPNSHPMHVAYALINKDIRDNGARWSKCANCGDPYKLTEEWDAQDICSDRCSRQYIAYLNSEMGM